jgi:hypothetical protein
MVNFCFSRCNLHFSFPLSFLMKKMVIIILRIMVYMMVILVELHFGIGWKLMIVEYALVYSYTSSVILSTIFNCSIC